VPPLPPVGALQVEVAASHTAGQSAMVGARQAPVAGSLIGVAVGQVVPVPEPLPPPHFGSVGVARHNARSGAQSGRLGVA